MSSEFDKAKQEIAEIKRKTQEKALSRINEEMSLKAAKLENDKIHVRNLALVMNGATNLLQQAGNELLLENTRIINWQEASSKMYESVDYPDGDSGVHEEDIIQLETRLQILGLGDVVISIPIKRKSQEVVRSFFGKKTNEHLIPIPDEERNCYVGYTLTNNDSFANGNRHMIKFGAIPLSIPDSDILQVISSSILVTIVDLYKTKFR